MDPERPALGNPTVAVAWMPPRSRIVLENNCLPTVMQKVSAEACSLNGACQVTPSSLGDFDDRHRPATRGEGNTHQARKHVKHVDAHSEFYTSKDPKPHLGRCKSLSLKAKAARIRDSDGSATAPTGPTVARSRCTAIPCLPGWQLLAFAVEA